MAAGFLVLCIPTKEKGIGAFAPVKKRLLRGKNAAGRFIKQHIDKDDKDPDLMVQVFNSNGYFDKEWIGNEAVKEFVKG